MKLRPVSNPPNPYESTHKEWIEPPPLARLEVYEDASKSILSRNDSPDIPFTWSANPYRGCQHGCAYCYARPYHEYLGWGAGTDFETKITVKPNAAALLRKALSSPKWKGEYINFSGVTDCYQPLEAAWRIMRGCLEVCLEKGNPVGIVTKGFLVVRDIDLLAELNRVAGVRVYLSIPFFDPSISAVMEPQAPPPARRFEAVRRLSEAGIPVGVMVAPIIPKLNDSEIPRLIELAALAGASTAGYVPLRLPGNVLPVFLGRLREAFPLRAAKVTAFIRDIKGGRLNDPRFGHRMRGQGVYWDGVKRLFELACNRHGLNQNRREPRTSVRADFPLQNTSLSTEITPILSEPQASACATPPPPTAPLPQPALSPSIAQRHFSDSKPAPKAPSRRPRTKRTPDPTLPLFE